jgi:hypothetical protein
MQDPARRIVESRCNARLITAANEFISSHAETVVVAPTHSAGEELTHRLAGAAGAHRMTFVQLAADLARQSMSQLGLAPLSALGLEALAARVVYAARAAHELKYFEPVSKLPGFARALARTLAELRLAGIRPDSLAASGEPGEDLARLLARYEDDLEHRALADLARVLELAAQAAAEGGHRWTGLPLVSLDVPLDSQAHRNLFARVAKGSPAVLAAVSSGAEILAKMFDVTPENLDAGTSGSKSTLEHLRKYVFSPTPPAMEVQDSGLELFSAPSEGLETVEIARRILRLAHQGIAFDQVAILLRSPERYQPMIEDALRRAKIPAYFSRGSARPDPGGRAFLALLACAAEKCSASRFAEYLSLGQVPGLDASRAPGWVAAEDELLSPAEGVNPADSAVTDPVTSGEDEAPAPRAPLIWEKLLVDAAVIGGRDRWQRRLRGLEREFELRLKTVERDDRSAPESSGAAARSAPPVREFRAAPHRCDGRACPPRRIGEIGWISSDERGSPRAAPPGAGPDRAGGVRADGRGRAGQPGGGRGGVWATAFASCAASRRSGAMGACSSPPSRKRAGESSRWCSCRDWRRGCFRSALSRIRCCSTISGANWGRRCCCATAGWNRSACVCVWPWRRRATG